MIDDIILEAEDKMAKAVDVAAEEFSKIRSGRANASMFTEILVEYYGSPTPLQQLGSLTIPEARTVLISPYDRTANAAIVKALRDSDLGVNPTDDGTVIRVVLPSMTEERRRDYVRLARTKAEDARISIRSVRRRAKEDLETMKKDGDAGEDEVERGERELETVTKKHVDAVDALLAGKERELLEV